MNKRKYSIAGETDGQTGKLREAEITRGDAGYRQDVLADASWPRRNRILHWRESGKWGCG
jgi:hypothetical protein